MRLNVINSVASSYLIIRSSSTAFTSLSLSNNRLSHACPSRSQQNCLHDLKFAFVCTSFTDKTSSAFFVRRLLLQFAFVSQWNHIDSWLKMEGFSVSYKPPSFRTKSAKSVEQWLNGKKADDNADGLWRVHDKLYDVINFIHRHPGGADWLKLTQGTDITELFESHHISGKADLLLHSFYVCEAKKPRNYRITFCDDGFYKTLKKKIADQLGNLNRDAVQRSKVSCVVTDTFFIQAPHFFTLSENFRRLPHRDDYLSNRCGQTEQRACFCVLGSLSWSPHAECSQLSSSTRQLAHVLFQLKRPQLSRMARFACDESSLLPKHSARLWDFSLWAFHQMAAKREKLRRHSNVGRVSSSSLALTAHSDDNEKVKFQKVLDSSLLFIIFRRSAGYLKVFCCSTMQLDHFLSFLLPCVMSVVGKADLIVVVKTWIIIISTSGLVFGFFFSISGTHHTKSYHEGDMLP